MVGSICFATDQGLGYLAKDFYDNKIFDEVFVYPHSRRENHFDWYPNRCKSIEELLNKADVLLFFETPHDWNVILEARKRKIKTALMVMYECTRLPYFPDVLISPSMLDKQYYPESIFIPVPVKQKFKKRTKAEVFVHNAGNGGLGGRNGTKELLEAMEFVKSPIKLIIRLQEGDIKTKDPRIEIRQGNFSREGLYQEGDVFIFPEKFNGLSLPLQEAFASGMMVMAGDRFPMNTWLPKEPLIPTSGHKQEQIAVKFNSAIFEPRVIATCIDYWFGKDISKFSLLGKDYAKENSWDLLKKRYIEILQN